MDFIMHRALPVFIKSLVTRIFQSLGVILYVFYSPYFEVNGTFSDRVYLPFVFWLLHGKFAVSESIFAIIGNALV